MGRAGRLTEWTPNAASGAGTAAATLCQTRRFHPELPGSGGGGLRAPREGEGSAAAAPAATGALHRPRAPAGARCSDAVFAFSRPAAGAPRPPRPCPRLPAARGRACSWGWRAGTGHGLEAGSGGRLRAAGGCAPGQALCPLAAGAEPVGCREPAATGQRWRRRRQRAAAVAALHCAGPAGGVDPRDALSVGGRAWDSCGELSPWSRQALGGG